jgi:serine/threonine-protein kinase
MWDGMPTCQDCGAQHAVGEPCRGQFRDEDESFAADPVRPGTVLGGQWRVESRLGKGGMSSVFLAVDERLGRKVAVKVLAEELCHDTEGLARFDRETRRTAQMEHPNIVPVYATGRHGARPFVVMKHLEGMPLSRYLRTVPTPLPLAEVRALMKQLCAALQYIHTQGVIHRDIKPSNLFVTPDGHLTVLDLGIALDMMADPITRTGVVMGTPRYIAPEQALGKRIDHRADLFSTAVLLSDLLGSKRPGDEGPEDARLPALLAAVVERGLSPDPARRFADAQELGATLEAAFAAVLNPAAPPKRRTRGPLIAIAAGVVVLAAAGVSARMLLLPHDAPSAPQPEVAALAPEPEQDAADEQPAAEEAAEPPAPTDSPAAAAPTKPAPAKRVRASHLPARARQAPAAAAAGSGHLRVVTQFQGESTWANLMVDGIPRGAAPLMVEVPAGHHTVRIERAGFATVAREVDVKPGASALLTVEMNP